jgi:hypothetical protein
VSHESRLGRIEEMLADMLHPQRELPSDAVLAQAFGQTLALYARDGNYDAAVELARTLFPDADPAWVKDNFGPDVFDRHQHDQVFQGVPQAATPAPDRDFTKGNAANTTRITVQRTLTEQERIVSPEFERQRMSNIGLKDLNGGGRQERAITGSKRFKR